MRGNPLFLNGGSTAEKLAKIAGEQDRGERKKEKKKNALVGKNRGQDKAHEGATAKLTLFLLLFSNEVMFFRDARIGMGGSVNQLDRERRKGRGLFSGKEKRRGGGGEGREGPFSEAR